MKNQVKQLQPPLWMGLIVFSLLLIGIAPWPPKDISWVKAILIFAPLLFVPMGWIMAFGKNRFNFLIWAGGVALGLSYTLPAGYLAGTLSLIWLLTCLILGYLIWLHFWEERKTKAVPWSHLAAFLYLPIGAAWALADRLGIRPLDFSPTIVLLTAVHFHYAGFILPFITSKVIAGLPKGLRTFIDLLVVGGVPLVAVGITTSQLEGPIFLETISATIMASGGFGVAILHLWKTGKATKSFVRWFWRLGGLCLASGMVLALAYGWRPFFPLDFLTIPWMYAVHGTLNAAGVGMLLMGWYWDGD